MKVRIPSSLRRLTGAAAVEETAATTGELVTRLDARFPGFAGRICEPDGQLKRHINIFVNGVNVRDLQMMDTALAAGDEVLIAPAMAGG
jgi:molybdopterin synthase sulfur carrier subunit